MTDQPDGPLPAHDGAGPPTVAGRPRPPAAEHHYRRLEHLAHAIGAHDPLPIDPDLAPHDEARPSLEHRRPAVPVRHHRARPAVLAVIFVGGLLGTLGRYGVEQALRAPTGHFPTGTFVVNTTGAVLIGLIVTVLLERLRRPHPLVRPFAVTGILGGWTTYSTLVVGTVGIGHAGHLALAAGYLALTLVCGVVGATLGIALGRSRRLDALGAVAPEAWVPAGEGTASTTGTASGEDEARQRTAEARP